MALLGSDFDPTVPADLSPRRDGARWMRDIKTRLKAWAGQLFDLETGNFLAGAIPSSALVPTNAAGIWTKVTVNAQGQVIAGERPTTVGGLGISDAFDSGSVIPIVNGGTGLSSVPAGGRRVLIGKNSSTLAWYQIIDSTSVVWTFDNTANTLTAVYNSPLATPQPQVTVYGKIYGAGDFSGRIVLVPSSVPGPNGAPATITLLSVKIFVDGTAWTGHGGLSFCSGVANVTPSTYFLTFPESSMIGNARLNETSPLVGVVTTGLVGSWPCSPGDDLVMFTSTALPPTAGGNISIAVTVQLT